ncbi:MAG: MFS transporter, partial [Gordonia sp. (in: high G+C Gram-positive bacteria)]
MSLLANKEFAKLFAGYAVSSVGDGLQLFALTFVVIQMGGSAAEVALVLAAKQAPTLAFSLFSGVWADRLDRRKLLLASDLICGCCQIILGIFILSGHGRIWHLIVVGAIFGTARSPFYPTISGL